VTPKAANPALRPLVEFSNHWKNFSGVFQRLEKIFAVFPMIGNKVSNGWKNRPVFSNDWKTFFQWLENLLTSRLTQRRREAEAQRAWRRTPLRLRLSASLRDVNRIFSSVSLGKMEVPEIVGIV
jgi:hypothetical protein